MADFKDYKVPQVAEQYIKVPGKQGGANDIWMKNPAKLGGAKNPGASADPHFGREFNAEADFQALCTASAVRANKARLGAALAAGERRANNMGIKISKSGGPVGERRGANNAGVRTSKNNSFDQRSMSRGNTGSKMDGGKGRW